MATSIRLLSILALLSGGLEAHEFYPGQCPQMTPMLDFNWNEVRPMYLIQLQLQLQFSNGTWFVTRKFATKSSCLTYQFETDDSGFKSVKQMRRLPFSDRLPVDPELV